MQRPAPHTTRNGGYEHRGDQHVAGDCDAIGVGERIRAAEPEHQAEHRRYEQPIDLWHVDLTGRLFRGLPHIEARYGAELNCLLHKREGARNHGLARNHRSHRGEPDERDQQPSGNSKKNGLAAALGVESTKAPWPR